MSKKQKLEAKFKSLPSDFSYDELKMLLKIYGYFEENCGFTTGSAVRFINNNTGRIIRIHKPHPGNIVKGYILKQIKRHLEEEMHL